MNNDLAKYDVARNMAMGIFTLLYTLPALVLAKLGSKQAQRLVSLAWDLSSCAHCEISFNYVESEAITYYRNEGAGSLRSEAIIPLCKDCFAALPIELIDWYIESLIHNWERYAQQVILLDVPGDVTSNAKAEARRMKAK